MRPCGHLDGMDSERSNRVTPWVIARNRALFEVQNRYRLPIQRRHRELPATLQVVEPPWTVLTFQMSRRFQQGGAQARVRHCKSSDQRQMRCEPLPSTRRADQVRLKQRIDAPPQSGWMLRSVSATAMAIGPTQGNGRIARRIRQLLLQGPCKEGVNQSSGHACKRLEFQSKLPRFHISRTRPAAPNACSRPVRRMRCRRPAMHTHLAWPRQFDWKQLMQLTDNHLIWRALPPGTIRLAQPASFKTSLVVVDFDLNLAAIEDLAR